MTKELTEIVFELSKAQPVTDKETNEVILGITKQNFMFTCPYQQREGRIHLVEQIGRSIFDAGFSDPINEMTSEVMEGYATRYLNQEGLLKGQRQCKILGTKISPKETTSQFTVQGVIYSTD